MFPKAINMRDGSIFYEGQGDIPQGWNLLSGLDGELVEDRRYHGDDPQKIRYYYVAGTGFHLKIQARPDVPNAFIFEEVPATETRQPPGVFQAGKHVTSFMSKPEAEPPQPLELSEKDKTILRKEAEEALERENKVKDILEMGIATFMAKGGP